VVAWSSKGPLLDSDQSIQGQRYASDGSAQGGEFQVNTAISPYQFFPSVATREGGFVVAWASFGSFGTDTSSLSIQGQRYRLPLLVPAMSPATRFALAVALLLLGTAYALRRRS
jgi:hypothetical protein